MLEINRNYNIDCKNGLQLLDDNCIDLTVTSPPYDNLRDYKGYSFDFENIAKELYRVTKKGGVIVWIVNDAVINGSESGTSFRQALFFMQCGFNLHDTMIWCKTSPYPDDIRYRQSFEYMFIFSKGKPKTVNLLIDLKRNHHSHASSFRQKNGELKKPTQKQNLRLKKANDNEFISRTNVWSCGVGLNVTTKDKFAYEHPAMFPEKLIADHIKTWSNENDLILDIFMGSGTTAKVSKLLNRNFLGFEISSEYCKIIEKRINNTKDLFI